MKNLPDKEEEWKGKLTPEEYRIMREKGTEAPFSGKYVNTKTAGVYKCKACGNELFSSETKFDSGTGWPSFDSVISNKNIKTIKDEAYGMDRVEVLCSNCDAHLGHVFPDGPTKTGQRYCINSVCLELEEKKEDSK